MEKHVGERVGVRYNIDPFEPDRPAPTPIRPCVGDDMLLTRNGNRDDPLGVWRIQEQLDRGGQIAARRKLDVGAQFVSLFVARR